MRVGENAIRADWRMPAWDTGMTQAKRGAPRAADTTDLAGADDRALVAAFRSGRREAFDLIVTRHRRSVYQLCYRFVNNHEDASDLAQDVFVRAFKGLANFKGDASLATWLYRVAVNASLNRVAASKPAGAPLDDAINVDGRAADPLHEVLREERAEAVRRAIAKLPPKQKATLMLRVYQDCSHEEIAAALGSTVGAVKANFFHALGNLRRMLGTS
jgi:RNA polymerase sigma-70 factor (ECF subfamily)